MMTKKVTYKNVYTKSKQNKYSEAMSLFLLKLDTQTEFKKCISRISRNFFYLFLS